VNAPLVTYRIEKMKTITTGTIVNKAAMAASACTKDVAPGVGLKPGRSADVAATT